MSGEGGLGKNKVQLCQKLLIGAYLLGIGSGLIAQVRQHGFDLFFLLRFQFPKLIVQLDNGHRLNEQRGACGRLVMDHAGYLAFMFGFYRQTVAPVPHGDDRVLKVGAVGVEQCV